MVNKVKTKHEEYLLKRGWTRERLSKLIFYDARPKVNISGKKYGFLEVIKPCGSLGGEIAWLCKCECGNKDIKTLRELEDSPQANCGCKDKSGEAYEYWEKNRERLGVAWKNNFIKFRDECFIFREGKKYLNRRFPNKKLSQDNFFWSENTEEQHRIHEKVVQMLVFDQGLTHEAALEKTVLMSWKKKKRLLALFKDKQGKEYDRKFMERYGKKPPEQLKEAKSIRLPTNALYALAKLLETSKYDEPFIQFIFDEDSLSVKLARLPAPIGWNNEKGDWDL
jgi:hypothetical protein